MTARLPAREATENTAPPDDVGAGPFRVRTRSVPATGVRSPRVTDMARALVTGSRKRVATVAAVLRDSGVDVVTPDGDGDLDGADLTGGLDHYVQLPVSVRPDGANLVGRVRSFLSAGLIARYAVTEQVLPALNDGATVVLVSGSTAQEVAGLPDDRNSRLALLHVLAHACRAEVAERGVRVTVVSGDRDDDELVAFALHGGTDPSASVVGEPSDAVTAKQYEDWRTEIMGLATDHV